MFAWNYNSDSVHPRDKSWNSGEILMSVGSRTVGWGPLCIFKWGNTTLPGNRLCIKPAVICFLLKKTEQGQKHKQVWYALASLGSVDWKEQHKGKEECTGAQYNKNKLCGRQLRKEKHILQHRITELEAKNTNWQL